MKAIIEVAKAGSAVRSARQQVAASRRANLHTDIARLELLGLVERTEAGAVLVPYESVEILVPLGQVARRPG